MTMQPEPTQGVIQDDGSVLWSTDPGYQPEPIPEQDLVPQPEED